MTFVSRRSSSRFGARRIFVVIASSASLGACALDRAPVTAPSHADRLTLAERDRPGEVAVLPAGLHRVGFYVAPTGSSTGDGSVDRPWDLATALAGGGGAIRPGDTVWVRGGTYRGAFVSVLTGAAGAPVVVRQYPGERAIIDGAGQTQSTYLVRGAWSELWDLELTNSDPTRYTPIVSHEARPNTLVNEASHTKYVNLIVHDGGVAFYTYPTASDVEVSGSIFYNNGWQGPTRGHGHALYVKSITGPVVLEGNVMFNQYGYGVHVYSDAGSGPLNNVTVEGNVAFNNGTLASVPTAANILVGGEDPATGDSIRGNFTFLAPGVATSNVVVGWKSRPNGDAAIEGNYFVGGDPVLDVGAWDRLHAATNVLVGTGTMVRLNDSTLVGYAWGPTRYHRDPAHPAWVWSGVAHPLALWAALTGVGATDVSMPGMPNEAHVVVRPNRHQRDRATVIVYNWSRQSAVLADLSSALRPGVHYDVRSVQHLAGPPLVSGVYSGGAISIPVAAVRPPDPIGAAPSRAPITGPDFDVFLVTRKP